MNQKERRQQELTRHYESLEKLAIMCGVENPNGKKLSNKLRAIELRIEKPILDYCNGDIIEPELDTAIQEATNEVQDLFKHNLVGFFINTDPRGYALKIKENFNKEFYSEVNLHRDWGGYGILAPEITGK